jgi:alkaline phosphatase/streptomycin-6-phosphatase
VTKPLNVDRMPFTGFDTTWSVKPAASAPYLPDYDPDSASTGTAWATGQKTLDERISQGPSSDIAVPGKNLATVLELAQKEGMKVGDVSTAEITDATPAVLASHISLRGCQGPADMALCPLETKAAGGLGSIAEQEIDHKVDVLLGGGLNRFAQTIPGGPDAGKTLVQVAQERGYRYVTDADGLSTVANASKPVLGLFNKSNMSLEWTGPAAATGKGNAPVACSEGQRGQRAEPGGDDHAGRSARRSPSIARSASPSTTRKTTRTPWSWSPPTTRTRARSSARTPRVRASRRATRPTC